MSFGFGVGDIIAVTKLAIGINKIIRDRGGVTAELRKLVETMQSLHRVSEIARHIAEQWMKEKAGADNGSHAPYNALLKEHEICKRLLEDFCSSSSEYTRTMLNHASPTVRRQWMKTKWQLFHSPTVLEVEAKIRSHVEIIEYLSTILQK